MNKIKSVTVPIGVLLIAVFYIFGAIALLILLFVNPEPAAMDIAMRHGLPASTGNWILPVIAGVGLIIAYGLLSLSRWGFYLTLAYLLYFGIVNLYLSDATWVSVYCGDTIWSFLVIVYLILVRRRFFGEREINKMQEQT